MYNTLKLFSCINIHHFKFNGNYQIATITTSHPVIFFLIEI